MKKEKKKWGRNMNKIISTSPIKIYMSKECSWHLLERRGRMTNPHVIFKFMVRDLIMEYGV